MDDGDIEMALQLAPILERKAGVRVAGFDAGWVRPPLDDLTVEEEDILGRIIDANT